MRPARALLARHGRSVHFASRLLGARHAARALAMFAASPRPHRRGATHDTALHRLITDQPGAAR